MSNEPLGIFEELQARRRWFNETQEAKRRRWEEWELLRTTPPVHEKSDAQLVGIAMMFRMKKLEGFFSHRTTARRRKVWPEAQLGRTIFQVVGATIAESGCTAGEMSDWRHQDREVSIPRHAAFWAIDRYCPKYSLPEVAYVFHRDHTTILAGIRRTERRLAEGHQHTHQLIAGIRRRLAQVN